MMTGSEGVSFLFPQDFFSQQRLEIQRWFLFIIHTKVWYIDEGKLHTATNRMCLRRFDWTSLEWPSNKRLAKKLMANKSHDLEVENLILTKENDNIFSLVIRSLNENVRKKSESLIEL